MYLHTSHCDTLDYILLDFLLEPSKNPVKPNSAFWPLAPLVELRLTMYVSTCVPSIPDILNSGMLVGVDISLYLWGWRPTTCKQGGVFTHKHS